MAEGEPGGAMENLNVLWRAVKRGKVLTDEERGAFRDAYWSGTLPKDDDCSLYQWVEDGMPSGPDYV